MTQDPKLQELNAEPPALVKQLRWIHLHWRKHWKLLAVAALLVAVIPAYKFAKGYYTELQVERSKSAPLGEFEITIENRSAIPVSISNVAEFYLHAPETPGMNRQISSGLIHLKLAPGQYELLVAPSKAVSVKAVLLNEERLLPYLDAGEIFGLIIFSASPKPISTEILFTRDAFHRGVPFLVGG